MRERILVVDDESDMTDLLGFHLRQRSYRVFIAHTGLDALNLARRHLPDLVLLDLMMEGIDGFTVCEILRSQPSTARTPVIALTALAGQMARLSSLASGATEFVNKPFELRSLLALVETTLAAERERKEKQLAEEEAAAGN